VAATSARNAWAVGESPTSGAFETLILRWNGTAWKQVPSPGPAGNLLSVAATSARNAWAVGYPYSEPGSLILHWNGAAWRRVPSPRDVGLVSVAVTSAWSAWAVGQDNLNKTVILHWNGRAWRRVLSPSPPGARLMAVAATSARNAWAVGFWQQAAGNKAQRTLILHWKGAAWKQVPSPNPPGNDSLGGVAALSARNAWAVGYQGIYLENALILHWNGTAWKRVPSPSPPETVLEAVAATSARNAWAVGLGILHWSGIAWKQQARNLNFGVLSGVAGTSARNAWAVGRFCTTRCGGGTSFIVILHWNGTAWKPVTKLPPRQARKF
jgi:hypothetical protein